MNFKYHLIGAVGGGVVGGLLGYLLKGNAAVSVGIRKNRESK